MPRYRQAIEKLPPEWQGPVREARQMVGGLSDAVGYGLEDRAIKALPPLPRQRYGITVEDRLVRKFLMVAGRLEEVNG